MIAQEEDLKPVLLLLLPPPLPLVGGDFFRYRTRHWWPYSLRDWLNSADMSSVLSHSARLAEPTVLSVSKSWSRLLTHFRFCSWKGMMTGRQRVREGNSISVGRR